MSDSSFEVKESEITWLQRLDLKQVQFSLGLNEQYIFVFTNRPSVPIDGIIHLNLRV